MKNSSEENKVARSVLRAADSNEMYEPNGFDRLKELARVKELANQIEKQLKLRAVVDSPSGFQDGSLFTKIMLFAQDGSLPGQILISAFGGLVTTWGVKDGGMVNEIAVASMANHYLFIPSDDLDRPYDGVNKNLEGISWMERFFSEFYILRKHFL